MSDPKLPRVNQKPASGGIQLKVPEVKDTDETEVFTRQGSQSAQSDQFAKPKGEQTRSAINAMKNVLAKLKAAEGFFQDDVNPGDARDPLEMLNML